MENSILIKGIQANYKVIGEMGKPLLILHGWDSNSDRWVKVAELLVQKGYMVIIPDLPGFGKSQEPAIPWNLDSYVDWLKEFTQQLPELGRGFCLLGHSFGGALASKFSIKYPQQVEKLFLVSAACVRKNAAIKKVFYRISKLVKLFSFLPFYPFLRKAVYKFIIRKSDYIYQQGFRKETYLNVILEDLSYKVGFIKIPTFLIWGDKDTSTPLEQAQFLQKKIPHAKLTVIPNADHSLHIKMPDILANKIPA